MIIKKIKSVSLYSPFSKQEEEVYYCVGTDGVTLIEPTIFNKLFCYNIYKDKELYAQLYHFSLVIYFDAGTE